jgi:hypothetical protein
MRCEEGEADMTSQDAEAEPDLSSPIEIDPVLLLEADAEVAAPATKKGVVGNGQLDPELFEAVDAAEVPGSETKDGKERGRDD